MGLSILLFVHFGQILFDLGFERLEVVLYNMQHTPWLYVVIVMHKHVSHTFNILPCGHSMLILEFLGKLINCLSDDFNVLYDTIIN